MDIVKNHYGAYGIGVEYVYTMVHGAPPRNSRTTLFPLQSQSQVKLRAEETPPFLIHLENLKGRYVSAELILHNAKIAYDGVPCLSKRSHNGRKDSRCGKDEEFCACGPANACN